MQHFIKFPKLLMMVNIFIALAILFYSINCAHADWRTASRAPLGIAPDPAVVTEAVVQVYAARAHSWRGVFGVHTWISIKEDHGERFTNYEVLGWRVRQGGPAVSTSHRPPDSRWFGSEPEILAELRGAVAADIIPTIKKAVENYPYKDRYTIWPGPNSNTFVAHIARQVPELRLDLPPTAIGKDYIPGNVVAYTPSGTGAQFSLFGLLGVMVGVEEGVEVNILGLTFGIDPLDLSLKLPMAGRVGP
jgi:hypothetical protein